MKNIKDSHGLIAKNSFWLGSSKVVQILINLAASIIIARYLGVKLFGQYALIFMIATVLEVTLSGGFCTVVTREVARDKSQAKSYFFSTLIIQMIIGIIILICVPIAIWFVYKENSLLWASLIMASSVCLRSIHALNLSIFRAFERMVYELKLTTLGRVLYLVLLLVAISLNWKIVGIFASLLIAQLIQTSGGIYLLRRNITVSPKNINWMHKFVLREGWVISINAFLTSFTFKIHSFLLKVMSGDFAVGIFGVVIRLFEQGKLLPRIPLVSTFPTLSRLGVTNTDKIKKYLVGALGRTLLISLLVASVLFFAAEHLITFLYGKDFLPSAQVIKILSIMALFIPMNMLFHYVYIAMNQQNLITILLAMSVMVHVVLGILLIPNYSYLGAGWAFVGGEVVLFILSSIMSFRLFYIAERSRVNTRGEIFFQLNNGD